MFLVAEELEGSSEISRQEVLVEERDRTFLYNTELLCRIQYLRMLGDAGRLCASLALNWGFFQLIFLLQVIDV